MSQSILREEFFDRLADDGITFRFLERSTFSGIWYWSLEDPAEVWCSPSFLSLLGFEAEEAERESDWWRRRIHPDDFSAIVQDLSGGPGELDRRVVRYLHKNGRFIRLNCRRLVYRSGGNPTRVLGLHELADDRSGGGGKKYESLVRALEESNIELQQFAYVASHDLKAPLRQITSWAEVLRLELGEELSEQRREVLDFIVEGAKRMNSLVEDLLSFSRLEARSGAFSPVDLNDVLKDALRQLQHSVESAQATISSTELPHVMGDRSQLVLLFQNLLGNAITYVEGKPPEVSIYYETGESQIVVSIADNGIGIPPSHREEVFELFKRLHGPEDYPGTGLGLALCQRIVRRHAGDIWVDSTEGGGSVFSFSLRRPRGSSSCPSES